ncbi:hypothetical protein Mapa_007843 [Marchantia paleacea]|nr:hypothetical protein Mapa_007843 [Marchantia paleacea]
MGGQTVHDAILHDGIESSQITSAMQTDLESQSKPCAGEIAPVNPDNVRPKVVIGENQKAADVSESIGPGVEERREAAPEGRDHEELGDIILSAGPRQPGHFSEVEVGVVAEELLVAPALKMLQVKVHEANIPIQLLGPSQRLSLLYFVVRKIVRQQPGRIGERLAQKGRQSLSRIDQQYPVGGQSVQERRGKRQDSVSEPCSPFHVEEVVAAAVLLLDENVGPVFILPQRAGSMKVGVAFPRLAKSGGHRESPVFPAVQILLGAAQARRVVFGNYRHGRHAIELGRQSGQPSRPLGR